MELLRFEIGSMPNALLIFHRTPSTPVSSVSLSGNQKPGLLRIHQPSMRRYPPCTDAGLDRPDPTIVSIRRGHQTPIQVYNAISSSSPSFSGFRGSMQPYRVVWLCNNGIGFSFILFYSNFFTFLYIHMYIYVYKTKPLFPIDPLLESLSATVIFHT